MGPRAGLDKCGKSRPHRDSFLCILSVLLCPYCTTHNTNIHDPDGIRTRNPSKRSAARLRLRPLGHWDRRIRSPERPARSESLYRLSYRGPFVCLLRVELNQKSSWQECKVRTYINTLLLRDCCYLTVYK